MEIEQVVIEISLGDIADMSAMGWVIEEAPRWVFIALDSMVNIFWKKKTQWLK
jgi:hypothetical protein